MKPEMNWGNYGRTGWHIDHIIPLSAFDLTDPNEVAVACHYLNLQPLWANENYAKRDKMDDGGLIERVVKAIAIQKGNYSE